MAAYTYSSFSFGPSDGQDLFNGIRTAVLAQGWTVWATYTANQNIIFRSPALDGGSAFILIQMDITGGSLAIRTAADWDLAAGTAINPATSGSGVFPLVGASGTCRFRCTNTSWVGTFIDNDNSVLSAGLHRRLSWGPGSASGMTEYGTSLVTNALTAGASRVLTTSTSLVGLNYVGQFVGIKNFAHVAANANAAHYELCQITSITPTSITVANLANNYDAGAMVGDVLAFQTVCAGRNPFNNGGSGNFNSGCQVAPFNVYMALTPDNQSGVYCATGGLAAFGGSTESALFSPTFKEWQAFALIYGGPDATTLVNSYGMVRQVVQGLVIILVSAADTIAAGEQLTDGTDVYRNFIATSGVAGASILIGPTGEVPNASTMKHIRQGLIPASTNSISQDNSFGPGAVAPVITNVSPAVGTTLPGTTTPLTFDIAGGFTDAILAVSFAGSVPEVARINGVFTAPYIVGSTFGVGGAGYHVSLVRSGGWPGAPTVTPVVFSGAENA
jgi:hypothetical protein